MYNGMIFEGDLGKRIEEAKSKAERVFYGIDNDTEEATLRLQLILSLRYNIPIFDAYFKDRTIDDLIYEIEILKLADGDGEQKMEDILKDDDNRSELEGLFDDWVEEDRVVSESKRREEIINKEEPEDPKWVDMGTKLDDTEFDDIAEEFMKSNEFTTGDENGDQ